MLPPQKLQRHAWSLELAMDCRPVRQRAPCRKFGQRDRCRIETYLQRLVGHLLGQRPGNAGFSRSVQASAHCRGADAEARRDLAFP